MNKVVSIIIELFLLNGGLYFLITTLGKTAGYYTIGEGHAWVQLFFWIMLILDTIFYALIRIGMETKQKFWFFVPGVIYLLLMLIGPGAWFSSFSEGFLALGMVGLLFIALPISILLALRHLFLKLLAKGK
ncbi:MAG TPA: hypothetical protein VJC15_03990 [Candidatus Paceibacterota bacterium]